MPKPVRDQVATVSDHAIVRYLERVCGIDIEAVRRRILTPAVRRAIAVGVTAIQAGDMRYVIRGRTVVTVEPLDRRKTVARPILHLPEAAE